MQSGIFPKISPGSSQLLKGKLPTSCSPKSDSLPPTPRFRADLAALSAAYPRSLSGFMSTVMEEF